ncbi:MAG: multiheme c-type cytochrome, partial [Betaproteobacteria bacterium]
YHQFLDKQWNSYTKLWEGYGQKNDWETQCTTCHVTGYRVTEFDEKTSSIRKASFAEKNIGCEACHGPGGAHAASGKKTDIFNPRNAPKAEADKVCGYCHIRVENYRFKTGQGSASEQLPHPVVGQTYRAGRDDWTRWYPDQVLLVGIQPEDPVNKNYPKTDLADAFFIDEAAQKSGLFEARKHHQQYQEHLMSKHAKSGVAGCSDCHSPHSVKGKTVDALASCQGCHGNQFDARAMMPGLARTAGDLYMRAHTFNPNPRKPLGATSSDLKEPVFAPRR